MSDTTRFEPFPDFLFHIHRDGTFLGYIAKEESHLAVSPIAILGRTVAELMPESIVKSSERAVDRALETGSTQTFSYSLERDGALFEFEARVIPGIRDDALVVIQEKPA